MLEVSVSVNCMELTFPKWSFQSISINNQSISRTISNVLLCTCLLKPSSLNTGFVAIWKILSIMINGNHWWSKWKRNSNQKAALHLLMPFESSKDAC